MDAVVSATAFFILRQKEKRKEMKFKNPIKKQTFEVYLESVGEKVPMAINMRVLSNLEERYGTLNKAIEALNEGSIEGAANMIADMMTAGGAMEATGDDVLQFFTLEDFTRTMKSFEKAFNSQGKKKAPKKTRP